MRPSCHSCILICANSPSDYLHCTVIVLISCSAACRMSVLIVAPVVVICLLKARSNCIAMLELTVYLIIYQPVCEAFYIHAVFSMDLHS